jgi:dTDP-4-dehydrorhamnose 3,5-epimerase
MEVIETAIPAVLLIKPKIYEDARGFFIETYQKEKYASYGIGPDFVQDNHSSSVQGVLRGMHYQTRHTQGKLVRTIVGSIFDVAVDLRRSSPTFCKWVGEVLSADNHHQLWIPPGFAHGFYVMSERAEVVYKVTDGYTPEWDRSLRWDDPDVNILWPLVDGKPPLLSIKDARAPFFKDAETFD